VLMNAEAIVLSDKLLIARGLGLNVQGASSCYSAVKPRVARKERMEETGLGRRRRRISAQSICKMSLSIAPLFITRLYT
jgi:hypothetical protein